MNQSIDLSQVFSQHEGFCRVLLDAYALLTPDGKVIKCNQMLAQITGIKSKQILKANSFEEIIRFEHQQTPLTFQKLWENSHQNIYFDVSATPLQAASGNKLDLSLGVSHLTQGSFRAGLFLLLRDITAEKALLGKYAEKAAASERDALTGLYNRRYLEQALQELDLNRKNEKNTSLIILDIDFFKKINDSYGHQAGDFVIKTLGGLIKSTFRKSDIPARYGGEEFVVVLPGTSTRGAAIAAEKFRLSIESFTFRFEGHVIPVTLSSGVTGQDIYPNSTGEQLLAKADSALYSSKQTGRNRVSIHSPNEIQVVQDFLRSAA